MRVLLVLLTFPFAGCAGIDRRPVEGVPVRSTLLDDTGTAGKGVFELESGLLLIDGAEGLISSSSFGFGATESTDLFITWIPNRRGNLPGTEDGEDEVTAGVRQRLMDESDDAPAVLVGLELEEHGGTAELVFTKGLGGIAFHPSYQLTMLDEPGVSSEVTHGFGVLAGVPLGESYFMLADLSAFVTPETDSEHLFFQVGGGILVSESLALDAAVIAGAGDGAHDLVGTVGLTLAF
jgi:hypothetical protein